MIGLYINLIISILFIFPFIFKKNVSLDVYVIWGLYFASNVLALFYDPKSLRGFKHLEDYSDFYFVIYGIAIFYSLTPIYSIYRKSDRPLIKTIIFTKKQKKIIGVAILGAIYSIIYSIPFAIISLQLGAKEIRTKVLISDATVLPANVFTTIAVAFATFFSIYIGVFFLSIKSNLKPITKKLLLLATVSYLVNSLCFTARDGIIFFVLFSLIFVIVYWESFNTAIKKRVYFASILVMIVGVYFISSFTKDRFDNSSNGTIGYIACQPYVFAENIDRRENIYTDNFYGLSLRFPLLQQLLGKEVVKIKRYEDYEWNFGTFITDFYSIYGFSSLIFFLIIFTEYFRYQFKRSKNQPLKFTLVYTFYIHFIVSGLFYFRLGTFSGNIFILILISIISLLKKTSSKLE